MSEPELSLAEGMARAAISHTELWISYLAIGGNADLDDLRRAVETGDCTHFEHNLIAQALNDHFLGTGSEPIVAYRQLPSLPFEQE